jgi:CRP-like cAMP-binding protein
MKTMRDSAIPSGNHFLDALTSAQLDRVSPMLTPVHLEAGNEICQPSAMIDRVYFPVDCVLSIVTVLSDGRSVDNCTVGCEGAIGLLNALGSPFSPSRVFVQIGGRAFHMPLKELRRAAAEDPGVSERIVRHAQAMIAQAEQSVACNALHDVEARLCRWILMTEDRSGTKKLPLTQELLAEMMGVQRTTVTAAAQVLRGEGLIDYSRGLMLVTKRAQLEKRACECYAAAHAARQAIVS